MWSVNCSAIIKTLEGFTKGLHTRLSSKQCIKVDSAKVSSSTAQSGEEPLLKRKSSFMVKTDIFEDVLARVTALDGFPFNLFVTSKELRTLLLPTGYSDLPKSVSTICNRVVNYSDKINQDYLQTTPKSRD